MDPAERLKLIKARVGRIPALGLENLFPETEIQLSQQGPAHVEKRTEGGQCSYNLPRTREEGYDPTPDVVQKL